MDKKTTAQVAQELHITRATVLRILVSHPELRPAERIGNRKMFLWTEAEIEAVRRYRAVHTGQRAPNNRSLRYISKQTYK